MKRLLFCLLAGIIVAGPGWAAEYSQLWGRQGEKWSPQSRLPDFSFAGYHCGEKPLPVVAPGVSVKSFGAKGDGVADDSQAFLDALAKVTSGAIEVPPGRYKITQILEMKHSGVVLRGSGPDKSILFFPVPLHTVKPDWSATTTGERTSNYSWAGGFIWIRGNLGQKMLARVTGEAKRGATSLRVSSAELFQTGQRIEIYQHDDRENSLAEHLYAGDAGDTKNLRGSTHASLVCRVTKVEGNQVSFDRPLRFDVKLQWQSQIRSFAPTVTEVGVENLGFEFPNIAYQGHFTEMGNNAVAFSGVADCWVRNIRILNPDSGLFPGGCFCTIQGVVFESRRQADKSGSTGHHGIYFGGDDNLFTDFDFRPQFIHDITVSHCAGNVVSNGKGVDLCMDHHCRAPYENLFANLDAGRGTHLWRCGGGAALGKHCGARGTFWNIRAQRPQTYPASSFGCRGINLVGVQTDQPSETNTDGKWFENIKPEALAPNDIRQAQLQRRLSLK